MELCTLYLHARQVRVTIGDYEGVPLVEFVYLVFTRMPGESHNVFAVVLV